MREELEGPPRGPQRVKDGVSVVRREDRDVSRGEGGSLDPPVFSDTNFASMNVSGAVVFLTWEAGMLGSLRGFLGAGSGTSAVPSASAEDQSPSAGRARGPGAGSITRRGRPRP